MQTNHQPNKAPPAWYSTFFNFQIIIVFFFFLIGEEKILWASGWPSPWTVSTAVSARRPVSPFNY